MISFFFLFYVFILSSLLLLPIFYQTHPILPCTYRLIVFVLLSLLIFLSHTLSSSLHLPSHSSSFSLLTADATCSLRRRCSPRHSLLRFGTSVDSVDFSRRQRSLRETAAQKQSANVTPLCPASRRPPLGHFYY